MASRGDSASGSGHDSVPSSVPILTVPTRNVSDEFCGFLDVIGPDGCVVPRSCAACLRTNGCVIDPTGSCVSAATFFSGDVQDAIDFGLAQPTINMTAASSSVSRLPSSEAFNASAPQRWVFPAFSAVYCYTSDPVCQRCRQSGFGRGADDGHSSTPDTRFCLGRDGCVCIEACERIGATAPQSSRACRQIPSPSPPMTSDMSMEPRTSQVATCDPIPSDTVPAS
ncbi:hypothetical protein P43SY_007222 [Pythium insidiosum]|uniref:Uncharacterized protein n=1 Tax=Pythium insidiosum TaxID=114742 RepID=A0AAD5Q4G3_PYTIN|nr:hypothetical protein P43SY_007222 [Pythium insidiosum]